MLVSTSPLDEAGTATTCTARGAQDPSIQIQHFVQLAFLQAIFFKVFCA